MCASGGYTRSDSTYDLLGRTAAFVSVRHAMLGLLAQAPRHGYELHGVFQTVIGRGLWPLNTSQVYTTLNRLEDAGLVVKSAVRRAGGPDQHIFELTPQGRAELDQWYAQGVSTMHQRDEVYLKITIALGDEHADPGAIVREQRVTLYRDLHELATKRDEVGRTRELAQALLLDKAIMHIEADLRWLEMTEGRLHQMRENVLSGLPGRARTSANSQLTETN